MKIKIGYYGWFDNTPVITEFEGSMQEYKEILNIIIMTKSINKEKDILSY